jgi:hypothetical protein
MLNPAARLSGEAGRGAADTAPAKPVGAPLNGYDRIRLEAAMLGTGLVAQGAFGALSFSEAAAREGKRPPVDPELRAVLAGGARAGVNDVTITGLKAQEFAQSLRWAHIPGANRILRTYTEEPSRKSFLVLFFKKERLASLLTVLRLCRKILAAPLAAAARSLARISWAERIM